MRKGTAYGLFRQPIAGDFFPVAPPLAAKRGNLITKRIGSIFFAALILVGTLSAPAGATVLWDNGPFITCPGCGGSGADESELQFSTLTMVNLGFNVNAASGNLVADDFTVDGGVWDVTRVTVYAFQTNWPPATTINDLRFQIMDGPPDNPASSVVYGSLTNVFSGSDWSNAYRVIDVVPGVTINPIMRIYAEFAPGTLLLPPGPTGFVWQVEGSLGSGPLAPPVTILGRSETGNAFHHTAGAWAVAVDLGPNPGASQDVPFLIEGSKVASCNIGTGVVNIPVVTLDGSSKRYQVEMLRTPGTLNFSVTDSNKLH